MHQILRRQIIAGVAALVAAPLAVMGQKAPAVRRIGFLSLDGSDTRTGRIERPAFADALKDLGYTEGGNLVIEWRWAEGKSAALPELAQELVRSKVEIIVARNNPCIEAAIKATRDIPIVMSNAHLPVENGYVASLGRPGGSVTGVSYVPSETYEKALQILKELVPSATRIATLINANGLESPAARAMLSSIERAASTMGMTLHVFGVMQPEEVPAALAKIAASGIDAMALPLDALTRMRRAEIMAFLRDHRTPAIALSAGFVDEGGLAQYTAFGTEYLIRTASFVDRILKGARPADLPVEHPTMFTLALNRKTARALGITIPQSLLIRADRLIE